MRRALIAILFSSLCASVAAATPLTFGVHVGSSIPDLRDNGGNELSSGWSSRLAPFFGVSADWSLSSTWSVLSELNWAPQGGKRDGMQALGETEGVWTYANITNETKLNYIELPVLARWHMGGPSRLSLAAGPYVGLLVSAQQVTGGTSAIFADPQGTMPIQSPMSFDATTDIKDSVHPFNWGVQAGVGTARPFGNGEVTLDVRGGLGLSNIQKYPDQDGKNTTGALVVALGYSFTRGH